MTALFHLIVLFIIGYLVVAAVAAVVFGAVARAMGMDHRPRKR